MKSIHTALVTRTAVALALGLTICSGNPLRAQGTFPARAWPAGAGANALATADFNADGRLDIAVASLNGQDCGVLRSTGLGLFAPIASQPLGFQPFAVCAADFNGDGIPDLVAGSLFNKSLALGNPAGTLGTPLSFAPGIDAMAFAAHDFDLDGKPDLALADFGHAAITLLRNTGSGTFGTPIPIALTAGAFPWDVAIGDLTGDGIPDLVAGYATQTGGGIAWVPGLGGFTFGALQSISTIAAVKGLELADLDGDGDLDLAAAAGGQELVYINAGGGVLGAPLTLNASANSVDVDVADLDGDGRQDLIFVNTMTGGVEVFRALAAGGFSAGVGYAAGSSAEEVLAVDVDGDGAIDVAVASSSGVVVLRGNGTGALSSVQRIDASMTAGLDTADMNGDGIDDIVTAALFGTSVTIRLGNGTGGFGAPTSFAAGGPVIRLATGQINLDSAFDVAVVDLSNKLSILLGDGAGGLASPMTVTTTTAPSSMVIAELNGDGKADVAVTAGSNGQFQGAVVGVHFGNGAGGMSAMAGTVPGLTPVSISAGDLDGDGDIDLACANTAGVNLYLLFNNGAGVFSVTNLGVGQFTQALRIADLDGNGVQDLIVSESSSLDVLRGLGGGTFAPPQPYPSAGAFVLEVADFDGDSNLDVACAGVRLELYSGDGAGALSSPRGFLPGGVQVLAIATADVDGNGRLDLLESHQGLTLHVNQGESVGPAAYCVAKVNSLGCTPQIGWIGASSASATSGFSVRAISVRNNKPGLLLYGIKGRSALPFSGGVQCVRAPIKRSPNISSGGSPSGNNCSGTYSLDMNAFAAGVLGGTPLPALSVAGTAVTGQYWGRDLGFPAPNATTLSNAIEYIVGL